MKREVVEVCPYCDEEIVMRWDVEKDGYQAVCPKCGEELMLCDECFHSDDNEGQRCNWSKDGGCFRKAKKPL